MQSIVADTTPLNYLVLIQATDILPELYRTVLIPPAVKAELAHANTPAVVRAWISQPPAWLEVVSLKRPVDSALEHLDAGEREAISLASELQAILLLMDERDGVTIARHRGLKVVGTLAALDLAATHGLATPGLHRAAVERRAGTPGDARYRAISRAHRRPTGSDRRPVCVRGFADRRDSVTSRLRSGDTKPARFPENPRSSCDPTLND
jgi:predicted nucleic acid-binding protein